MNPTNHQSFRKKLLGWYDREKRDLPWRKTSDPYSILVSEIMLQQTQVATVIPYYERWLKRFPDFKTLAAAREPEVLKHWQGLGYYRRAKMLHKNARVVHAEHGGNLPSDPEILLSLPGIGRYTAGAVASIAFGRKAPVLDGNVIRILTRIFAVEENSTDKKTLEMLWQTAELLLCGKRPGDFNQAMMELGATVCTPQNPQCTRCPVSAFCSAYKKGLPEKYPVKPQTSKLTKLNEYAFIVRDEKQRLLVKKQAAGERWADLWAIPHFESLENGLAAFAFEKKDVKKLRSDKHGFTRYIITLHTFEARKKPAVSGSSFRWAAKNALGKMAFPAVHQKILDGVLNG